MEWIPSSLIDILPKQKGNKFILRGREIHLSHVTITERMFKWWTWEEYSFTMGGGVSHKRQRRWETHPSWKPDWTWPSRNLSRRTFQKTWSLSGQRRHEFKSWTRLIAFHIALITLEKVWIQLFSLQLWVNSRAGEVLQPWWSN